MGYNSYNLDPDGYISEAGEDPNNRIQCTGDEPWIGDDIRRWRLVNNEWVRLTDDELIERYGEVI